MCFPAGDESGADIGQIRSHRLGRQDAAARRNRPRQHQQPGKKPADFAHERKGRQRPAMSARTGCDQDEAIDTRLQSLVRMAQVDDIMQNDAAIAMNSADDFRRGCAQ
jgi:hypothetical protein